MAITTTQFLTIADNIAKSLIDLEAAFITTPASSVTTINNGQSAASNSLYAHFAALSAGDQLGKMGQNWQTVVSAVSNYTGISKSNLYALFEQYLEALDWDMGGVADFIELNGLIVHPEFAAAFNQMSQSGRTLGLRPSPVPTIQPGSVLVPSEQILATIAVTGAAAGTFAAGTPLDTTKYAGPIQMYLKNTGAGTSTGTVTSFTVTYLNVVGGSNQTATQALSATLAAGAKIAIGSAQGISVSAITVNSGGAAGDTFAIVVEPARSVTY